MNRGSCLWRRGRWRSRGAGLGLVAAQSVRWGTRLVACGRRVRTEVAVRERVRGVLVTGDGSFLVIKRIKPGRMPYWVLPGGGVEDVDGSLEAALRREVREELAGEVEIHSLVHILDSVGGREYFFLARVRRWDFALRTGPEFAEEGRGRYELQRVPLTEEGVRSVELRPAEVAGFLRSGLAGPGGLFAVPDLRADQSSFPARCRSVSSTRCSRSP